MKPGSSPWMGRVAVVILALLVALGVGLAGGGRELAIAQQVMPAPIDQEVVPLEVLKGPDNQTLAVVPIFIDGQGPFAFALDTGSSRSMVDRTIVDRLDLPIVGSEEVTGPLGGETADLVLLNDWQAGNVDLPTSTAFTVEFPPQARAIGLAGFLGSDVLSQYGSITIDFELEELTLHARP